MSFGKMTARRSIIPGRRAPEIILAAPVPASSGLRSPYKTIALILGVLIVIGYGYGFYSGQGDFSCTLEVDRAIPFLKKAYGDRMHKVLHVGPDTCSILSRLLKEEDTEAFGIEPYDIEDADHKCKRMVRRGFVRVANLKFPLPYRAKSFSLVIVSDALDYLSPKYLNRSIPELVRLSSNGLIIFTVWDMAPIPCGIFGEAAPELVTPTQLEDAKKYLKQVRNSRGYDVDCFPHPVLVPCEFWKESKFKFWDTIKGKLESIVIKHIESKTGKNYELEEILMIVSSDRSIYVSHVTFIAKVKNDDSAALECLLIMECLLRPDCNAPGPDHYPHFQIHPISIPYFMRTTSRLNQSSICKHSVIKLCSILYIISIKLHIQLRSCTRLAKNYELEEILKTVSSDRSRYVSHVTFTAKVKNDDSAALECLLIMECLLRPDCNAPGPDHYPHFQIHPISIPYFMRSYMRTCHPSLEFKLRGYFSSSFEVECTIPTLKKADGDIMHKLLHFGSDSFFISELGRVASDGIVVFAMTTSQDQEERRVPWRARLMKLLPWVGREENPMPVEQQQRHEEEELQRAAEIESRAIVEQRRRVPWRQRLMELLPWVGREENLTPEEQQQRHEEEEQQRAAEIQRRVIVEQRRRVPWRQRLMELVPWVGREENLTPEEQQQRHEEEEQQRAAEIQIRAIEEQRRRVPWYVILLAILPCMEADQMVPRADQREWVRFGRFSVSLVGSIALIVFWNIYDGDKRQVHDPP